MPNAATLARLRAAADAEAGPVLTKTCAVALAAALLDEVETRLRAASGEQQRWLTTGAVARHFNISRRAAETLCAKPGVKHSKRGKGWTRYNLSDLSNAMQKYGVG